MSVASTAFALFFYVRDFTTGGHLAVAAHDATAGERREAEKPNETHDVLRERQSKLRTAELVLGAVRLIGFIGVFYTTFGESSWFSASQVSSIGVFVRPIGSVGAPDLLKTCEVRGALALAGPASGNQSCEKDQVKGSNHPEFHPHWSKQKDRHEVHERRQSEEHNKEGIASRPCERRTEGHRRLFPTVLVKNLQIPADSLDPDVKCEDRFERAGQNQKRNQCRDGSRSQRRRGDR
jgi:hypothetical protein